MAEFKFKSGKKTLLIEGQEYVIDIGNYETMKAWRAKIQNVISAAERLKNEDDSIEALINMEKEVVELVLGDWDRLWEVCEHNVYSMLDLVSMLSIEISGALQEKQKAYGI